MVNCSKLRGFSRIDSPCIALSVFIFSLINSHFFTFHRKNYLTYSGPDRKGGYKNADRILDAIVLLDALHFLTVPVPALIITGLLYLINL